MKYATWKLNFTDPHYGTGPEAAIVASGNTAEAGWADGDVTQGASILGYLSSAVVEADFTDWDVKNVTQAQALAFCQAINPDAYIAEDGRIGAPLPEEA